MMRRAVALAALLLLTGWTYRAVWTAGFVYEDHNYSDSLTRPLDGWSDPRLSLVHPRVLTDLSFAATAGASPRVYHLVNLALHLAVGLVVAALLASWGHPDGGVLAAGLLWLHPMQSEAVAYVSSGRGELLASLGVVAALWALSADRPMLAFVCGLLALMAKESTAAGVVALWPLTVWLRRGVVSRVSVALSASVAAAVGVSGGLFLWRTPHVWHIGAAAGHLLSDAFRVVAPVGLSVDHGWMPLPTWAQGLTAAAVWAMLGEAVWSHPTGRWAWLSVTACLLPRLLMPQSELPHEHAWYLPITLLAMAAGTFLQEFDVCLRRPAKPSTSPILHAT